MASDLPSMHISELACPDPLEKIFRQVEEQNELRAQLAEVEDTVPRISRTGSTDNLRKSRRRGSISITRFGQLSNSDLGGSSAPMTPALSDIASKSPFIQAQLKSNNGSQTSFASAGTEGDEHHEEDHHVTQIHNIAPRQSISRAMGGLLPRRLSRARSTVMPTSSTDGMVIGVSVAAATVELPENAEIAPTVVESGGVLRNQTSKGSLASSLGKVSWTSKAIQFTKKFRRKSKVNMIPNAEVSAATTA